jgi:hypothetical protein
MFHQQRTFSGSGATEKRHVLPAGISGHAELGRAERIICMSSDRNEFQH